MVKAKRAKKTTEDSKLLEGNVDENVDKEEEYKKSK